MTQQVSTLSSDLPTITAEINAYKRVAGEAIFEIGRRLKSVRDAKIDSSMADERKLAQQREEAGGWIRWLEEYVDFKRTQAHRFITVYEKLGNDVPTWEHISLRILDEIATLPPEERTREHTLKSGETKTPNEMTVRELRELKAALKEEREARERAEARAQKAEMVRDQAPRVEYVEVPNASVEERLRRYEEKFGDIEIYEQGAARIASVADISASIQTFSYEARALVKKYGFLTQCDGGLPRMHGAVMEDYEMALDALLNLAKTLRDGFDSVRSGVRVINI